MTNIRTDLAIEAREIYQEGSDKEISGVAVETEKVEECDITRVEVMDQEGAEIIGKPIGNYITLESEEMRNNDEEYSEKVSQILCN